MLNAKNNVVLVLSSSSGNVLEMKANVVKFPFGKEKLSIDDLVEEDIESISLNIASVEVIDKEAILRNDVKGIHIDKQIGKTYSVSEFKIMVQDFNEDVDTPFDFSIPELNYLVEAQEA